MHVKRKYEMGNVQIIKDFSSPRPSRRSELLGEMKRDGSGFMTQREKEWVVKIQLLQLQGADPENDDYYYLVQPNFCLFFLSRSKLSSFRSKLLSPTISLPYRTM